jgi:hypothetical protein
MMAIHFENSQSELGALLGDFPESTRQGFSLKLAGMSLEKCLSSITTEFYSQV